MLLAQKIKNKSCCFCGDCSDEINILVTKKVKAYFICDSCLTTLVEFINSEDLRNLNIREEEEKCG